MKNLRSFLCPVALLLAGALTTEALVVKPNVAPVVANQIGDYDQFLETTRSIDLSGFFSDPDASAAAQLVTQLGTMNFTLDGQTTPITVANFLSYVNQGLYFKTDPANGQLASTFFHRSVANFVIQAGGFLGTIDPASSTGVIKPTQVTPLPAIQNEPVISNRRGTIAMAKIGGDPNSASSQWFINLADNSGGGASLDTQNGGFTVFGRVAGTGMSVADAIAALPKFAGQAPFNELPVRNYTSGQPVKVSNLVTIPQFTQISPFTFSAISANSAVAAVSVSGTKLLVEAKQIGSSLITVTARDLDDVPVSQNFTVTVTAAPGRLRNIATRANIGTGENVLIAGFIIGGGTSKRLAVRAIGPSLKSVLPNAMDDPSLQLFDGPTVIASNDNWADAPNKQELIDIHLDPTADKEAAILTTVPTGGGNKAYTAVVRGVNATSGIGLVEVFDLDSGAGSTILNLSSRAKVGTGGDVMIGGVIVGGGNAKRLIVRALGPSLSGQGVSGALPNPALSLVNGQGTPVDSNDDWQTHPNAAEIQADTVAPTNPAESALIDTLQPGNYTAIVSGAGATPTGVASVEIYQVP